MIAVITTAVVMIVIAVITTAVVMIMIAIVTTAVVMIVIAVITTTVVMIVIAIVTTTVVMIVIAIVTTTVVMIVIAVITTTAVMIIVIVTTTVVMIMIIVITTTVVMIIVIVIVITTVVMIMITVASIAAPKRISASKGGAIAFGVTVSIAGILGTRVRAFTAFGARTAVARRPQRNVGGQQAIADHPVLDSGFAGDHRRGQRSGELILGRNGAGVRRGQGCGRCRRHHPPISPCHDARSDPSNC